MQEARPERKLALLVEYDGTEYAGFQLQPNAPSIQGELERAIASLTQEHCRVQGAGRTDAGVHAKGQVAAFVTQSELADGVFQKGLNHYLPKDIAVQRVCEVSAGFDPRRHARSRRYRYTIVNQAAPSPLLQRYAYWVEASLDAGAMSRALARIVGVHDFKALAGSPGPGKSTVREVFTARLWQEETLVYLEIEANAFLPHQMRRIAGMLVSVGKGRLTQDGVETLVGGNGNAEYAKHAPTLPPQGLCLMQVTYKDCVLL